MTTDIRPDIAELTDRETELFAWTKQWYPVAVVEFLDSSRPHGMQLLVKFIRLCYNDLKGLKPFKTVRG